MAILYVRRKIAAAVDVGEKGKKSYRDEYTVRSDQPRESRALIVSHQDLPRFGSLHPDNTSLMCVKVNPVQNKEHPYLWDVAVEWSQDTGGKEDPNEQQKPPDERRQKWSFNFTPLNKSFFKDLDGKLFEDAAHTPFSPPPEIPIFVDEWTVKIYEPAMDREVDRRYMNSTNTSEWLNCKPGEALVGEISRNEVFEMGAYWFDSTYKVLVNPRILMPGGEEAGGWDPYRVLNAGPRELDNSTPPKPIPIKTGEFYDGQPCALDGFGHRIPLDGQGHYTQSPLVILFRVVNKKDFHDLPIYPPWLNPPPDLRHSLADVR